MKRLGLWLAVLAHLVLAGTHAQLTPVFEAPDENGHFTNAWHLLQLGEAPIVKDSGEVAGLPGWRQAELGHHPPLYYHLLALALRVQGAADLTVTGRNVPAEEAGGRFHFVHGWDEVGARSAEVRTFHRLRWISVLCGALSLVLAHGLVRRALPDTPAAADLSVGCLALLPGWTLPHAALDNGTLATTLMLAALAVTVRAVELERLTLVRGAAGGLLGGLALQTKLTAVGTVPLFGLAVLWIAWRNRERRRETLLAATVGGALLAATWAPWVLRNLDLYGEPLATGVHRAAYAVSVVPDELMTEHLTYALPVLVFRTAVGVIGWNAGYAPLWIRGLFVVAAVAAAAGWLAGGRRLGLRAGPALMLLASAVVALALLVRFNLVFHQPQARYALAGVAGFALLAGGGWSGLERRWPAARPALRGALLTAWVAAALHTVVAARALLRIDPAEVDPRAAALTADLFTPRPDPELTLRREGDREPPVLLWEPETLSTSIHLWCLDGPRVGGSFEHLGVAFEGNRATLPAAVWDSLPEGVEVRIKIRELPDRRAGRASADCRESGVLSVRRP